MYLSTRDRHKATDNEAGADFWKVVEGVATEALVLALPLLVLAVLPGDGNDVDGEARGEVEEEGEVKEREEMLVKDSRMLLRWCSFFARADRETEEDVEAVAVAVAVKGGETLSGCSSSSWVMGSWEPKE